MPTPTTMPRPVRQKLRLKTAMAQKVRGVIGEAPGDKTGAEGVAAGLGSFWGDPGTFLADAALRV